MQADPIALIRRFNRAVTREAGALDSSFLGRGRPLGAARVLHLMSADGTDITLIRERLGLDSGLLSRLLRSLEADGLAELATDPADRRRRIACLTAKGRDEMRAYHALNDERANKTLTRAGKRQDQLLKAMNLIATILLQDQVDIREADANDPAALACLAAYYQILLDKIPGVTPQMVTLPLADPEKYRPPHGAFLIAWSDDLPIGCVSVRPLAPTVGEVKRLWVDPAARGQGLARRLMTAIEDKARALGMTRLQLDTNSALHEAVKLYRATGWADITPYTTFPGDCWFGKDL
jgi:DNA-binding MarR family transcriptional regulator/GNAT superfamily N-acetyltransferase